MRVPSDLAAHALALNSFNRTLALLHPLRERTSFCVEMSLTSVGEAFLLPCPMQTLLRCGTSL